VCRSLERRRRRRRTYSDLNHVWNGWAEGIKKDSKRIPSWLIRVSIAITVLRERERERRRVMLEREMNFTHLYIMI